jgi:hypothetical protein
MSPKEKNEIPCGLHRDQTDVIQFCGQDIHQDALIQLPLPAVVPGFVTV